MTWTRSPAEEGEGERPNSKELLEVPRQYRSGMYAVGRGRGRVVEM